MQQNSAKALKVFISYAHQDKDLVEDLRRHLQTLQRKGLITIWYDRELLAGMEEIEIIRHLNTSQIILLMISSDFLASNYHVSNEMQQAMLLRARNKAHVIPIILRSVDWKIPPLDQLRGLPASGVAVTAWRDRDSTFLDITQEIEKVAYSLLGRGIDPPPPSPPSPSRTPDAEDGYYENLRKQVERDLDPLSKIVPGYSTFAFFGGIVARIENTGKSQEVYLLSESDWNRIPPGEKEQSATSCLVEPMIVGNQTISVAVFRQLLAGSYIIWAERSRLHRVTVTTGKCILEDLRQKR